MGGLRGRLSPYPGPDLAGCSRFRELQRTGASAWGFRLPNPVNEHRFATPSGKAMFTCNTVDRVRQPEGHLVLQTMRSHDQWNTVPYALNDRYRGIHNGRQVVLVNPADIEELGLADRQLVAFASTWDDGIG